jgi:hypothetical protein
VGGGEDELRLRGVSGWQAVCCSQQVRESISMIYSEEINIFVITHKADSSLQTSHVTLASVPAAANCRHAYLCVANF